MDRVHGYYSRLAQQFWPGALVFFREDTGRWVIERKGEEPLDLGSTEDEAHQALTAMKGARKHEQRNQA